MSDLKTNIRKNIWSRGDRDIMTNKTKTLQQAKRDMVTTFTFATGPQEISRFTILVKLQLSYSWIFSSSWVCREPQLEKKPTFFCLFMNFLQVHSLRVLQLSRVQSNSRVKFRDSRVRQFLCKPTATAPALIHCTRVLSYPIVASSEHFPPLHTGLNESICCT